MLILVFKLLDEVFKNQGFYPVGITLDMAQESASKQFGNLFVGIFGESKMLDRKDILKYNIV